MSGKDKDDDVAVLLDGNGSSQCSGVEVVSLENVRRNRDPGRRVVPMKDIITGRAKVASREPERAQKRRKRKEGDEDEEEEEEEEEDLEEEDREEKADRNSEDDPEAWRRGEIARINAAEGLRDPVTAGSTKKRAVRQAGVKNVWSVYETDKFYDSLRVFGTDFTLAAEKFGNRTRDQLVFKFHQEECNNEDAVTWAMRNSLDIPPEINPFELDLPCQLEGWSQEDLDKFYVVLLEEINKRQK